MGLRHLCQECHGDVCKFLYPEESKVQFGWRQDGFSGYLLFTLFLGTAAIVKLTTWQYLKPINPPKGGSL